MNEIAALFVLKNDDKQYIIFQYKNQARSRPQELTQEKINELLQSFTSTEPLALGKALARPNHWIKV